MSPHAAELCRTRLLPTLAILCFCWPGSRASPSSMAAADYPLRYYAHTAVHDEYAVIAPWYRRQNGQLDFRIRVAAETLKRYPWTTRQEAVASAPHYMFNGRWSIDADGTITPQPITDWQNGDLGQRSAYVLSSLVDYYRYSGDPAAIGLITIQADLLLDHCLTPESHAWPGFLISVPVQGKPYGRCDPRGKIQLDIVAEVGLALLQAYQITGETRWWEACCHWGDLLATRRKRLPGAAPWDRYALSDAKQSAQIQTGGIVFLLAFFDELIRLGHRGPNDAIAQARSTGQSYLREQLLERWTVDDTWGRNYWDWVNPVQAENVTEYTARYLLEHPNEFPNWRSDASNVLTLFLNRTSVNPESLSNTFSGAWAFPESSSCCGRSLWYGPMELAVAFAQYGVVADDERMREMARRMQILATYDGHPNGVSEDNIDGGFVVNNDWFKIAHPMALKHLLGTISWLSAVFGPLRENHIVRSTSVIRDVVYSKDKITYTVPYPTTPAVEVLRLSFVPTRVTADDEPLPANNDGLTPGYAVTRLPEGDTLVSIRHDDRRRIVVTGDDPQEQVDDPALTFTNGWQSESHEADFAGSCQVGQQDGATLQWQFEGNQVRLLGRVAPDGGLADLYLDGQRQLAPIDCWCPTTRYQQVLYSASGLDNTVHQLQLVVRGEGNARAQGTRVYIDAAQSSRATGQTNWGAGGGPRNAQRLVMGYAGRKDLRDAAGNYWRPGTEFIARMTSEADIVDNCWWKTPSRLTIVGTDSPELYRYGVHAHDFTVKLTTGPGTYQARLKFAANRRSDSTRDCISIDINGERQISCMDVTATAGGPRRAVDVVFPHVQPHAGVIDVRLTGGDPRWSMAGEACLQAIEILPTVTPDSTLTPDNTAASSGTGMPAGTKPITMIGRNLLRNGGFEQWNPIGDPSKSLTAWKLRQQTANRADSAIDIQRVTLSVANETQGGVVAQGRRSVRLHGYGSGRLLQDVAVTPGKPYRASVLASADLETGNGRQAIPAIQARLIVTELNTDGRETIEHVSPLRLADSVFTYAQYLLTTDLTTTRLRYAIEVRIPSANGAASLTLDQCVLDGEPSPVKLVGKVTNRAGRPIAGALVTVGEHSLRTAGDGAFAFDQFLDLTEISIDVTHTDYFERRRLIRLAAPETRCDFLLVPIQ